MSDDLTILAGKHVQAFINEKGFYLDLVRVMGGAAGGPRWLVLHRLDQAIDKADPVNLR